MKTIYVNYEIPSKKKNLHITGVQKEKKGRKEQNVYLKKQ